MIPRDAVILLKSPMMLGAPDQPIVKLQADQRIEVKELTWCGPHTLGYRFCGLYFFNAQSYLIEFNETQVEFVSGHPNDHSM